MSEPVAWQIKDFGGDWITRSGPSAERRCRKYAEDTGALVRPLYADPPASVDAVAVVQKYQTDLLATSKNFALSQYGKGKLQAYGEILAALRARRQATEARS